MTVYVSYSVYNFNYLYLRSNYEKGAQESWSSNGCTLIHNEMTAVAEYHQMGHFALLLVIPHVLCIATYQPAKASY